MSRQHYIDVSVRIKPINGSERIAVGVADNKVQVNGKQFSYPKAVICGSDQSLSYNVIAKRLLNKLDEGYSVTLLAYGQTGSGKTHTMFGPPGSLTEKSLTTVRHGESPKQWGIFPRTMLTLLQKPDFGSMHASVIEVYQDHAYDLLNDRKNLKVGKSRVAMAMRIDKGSKGIARNSGGRGYPGMDRYKEQQRQREEFKKKLEERRNAAKSSTARISSTGRSANKQQIEDSSFATVGEKLIGLKTPTDIAALSRKVEAYRIAKSHALNDRSSRGHCLVKVHVVTKERNTITKRQILFVDLAGSERIAKSKVDGMRQKEALNINGALSTLGRVIKALGAGSKHVPYRDSTLTMLLKSSFGGKSCTSVVINVAGGVNHMEETLCSLRFGSRMTHVQNKSTIVVGEDTSGLKSNVNIEEAIHNIKLTLESMKQRGLGPKFSNSANSSEIKSFLENLEKEKMYKRKLGIAQQENLERPSQAARQAIKNLEFQVGNMNMIILRQKSIKNFYIEPSTAYINKEAELQVLLSELQLAGGGSVNNVRKK
jgi:hypothetical protein